MHLLTLGDLERNDVENIIKDAIYFKENRKTEDIL